MRKIVGLFLFVIVLGFIITACGDIDESFTDKTEFSSLAGVLSKQSANDDFSGTHLLIDDNADMTPLRSLSINLSNLQYLGNRVEVMGVLNSTDNVFEVTGISVVEVLTEDGSLSSFEPYRNSELGFESKKYSDWKITESSSSVEFVSPGDGDDLDRIIVDQTQFDHPQPLVDTEGQDTPLKAYMVNNFGNIEDFAGLTALVGVDRLPAYKIENDDGVSYYLYRPGIIYSISFIRSKTASIFANESVFNSMVSEFRFIGFSDESDVEIDNSKSSSEDDSTASTIKNDGNSSTKLSMPEIDYKLTSFESLPYHFVGKYPASWYYAGSSSGAPGVLHHYAFSDETLTDDNELIGLDVFSGTIPANFVSQDLNGFVFYKHSDGSVITLFADVGGQVFRISGGVSYEDLMISMLFSITSKE